MPPYMTPEEAAVYDPTAENQQKAKEDEAQKAQDAERRKRLQSALGGPYQDIKDFLYSGGQGQGVPGWAQTERVRAMGMARPDVMGLGDTRAQQLQALQALQARAAGQNSIVEQQARLAQQQASSGVMSALASQRGGYSPAAMRTALMQRGDLGQQIAGQSMLARMQEQQGAENAYWQALGGLRQQDTGLAAMDRQWAMQQQALDKDWAGIGMNERQQQWTNMMNVWRTEEGLAAEAAARQQAENASGMAMYGTILGGIAEGAFKASDRRAKEHIKPADAEVKEFAEELSRRGRKQYDYRPEFGGEHSFGPMAQDLERTAVGRAMVREIGGTKMIDMKKALTALLAVVGHQQLEISRLKRR